MHVGDLFLYVSTVILKCTGESVGNCVDVWLIVCREDGTLAVVCSWSRGKGRKRRGRESLAIAGADLKK